MSSPAVPPEFLKTLQHNCDISDARDHGIYTMCTMVLKLRNLYKWEKGLQPWEEPEAADLLDWIEAKENHWATIAGEPFQPLTIAEKTYDPLDLEGINAGLFGSGTLYGAGFGRSMKTVFSLAEVEEERRVEGCPITILGKEWAREMASPFAMVQDGLILIRREPLRYFLWDQVQEVRSSCNNSIKSALKPYGVVHNGKLDREMFKDSLATIVAEELNLFIYHEIGELLQTTLSSATLRLMIGHFPGSIVEFVCRALKDILADTHPSGLLAYIVRERRSSSLGFYLAFLDGLRKVLFPEIVSAWQRFKGDRDWQHIEEARIACRARNTLLAGQVETISRMIGTEADQRILGLFSSRILAPLGLQQPKEG